MAKAERLYIFPFNGNGIEALLVNEMFIQGVTVSYHGGDGIKLDRCYEDPRVSDCLITYNKQTGLNLPGCHDVVVSANQLEENRDALHIFDGFNLCFTGNCVDDHLGDGVAARASLLPGCDRWPDADDDRMGLDGCDHGCGRAAPHPTP